MAPVRSAVAVAACAAFLAACGGDVVSLPTHTAEPVPGETASETPTPTPTPTPDPVAPLTGLPMDPDDVDRPAVVAKVENSSRARPQAGLEVADLVIEELVEGGVTRFFAVFHSVVPEDVGPIRSARLVDAELLPALEGAFVYSGGRPDVEASLIGTAVLLTEGDPGVYRTPDRVRPHDLFADGEEVLAEVGERDDTLGAPPSGFVFSDAPPTGACAACDGEAIDIEMSGVATAGWTYDDDAGLYRRDQDGVEQTTASGDPVGAANVVALEVTTFQGGCCDSAGTPYVVTRTTGEGRAVVLRDGRWYEARWERPTAADPWTLLADGDVLPFAPGPTWLHLVTSERMPPTPEEQASAAPTDADG